MKQARVFLPLSVSAVLVLSACPLFTLGMLVRVVLPDLPAVWADADGWEVSWLSPDDTGGPFRAAPGSALELVLPRGGEAAVLCQAVYGSARTLPYGAPWPQGLSDDGILRLDAAGGYAASLAAAFYRAGCDICPLDLSRFAREAAERLADPWDIDPASFSPVVAGLAFRVDYLRAPVRAQAAIGGVPRALAPDSSWGRRAVPDGSGNVTLELAAGRVRRWIGGGYELAVSLSTSGDVAWTMAGP